MNTKAIVIGLAGLGVVLYLIYKLQPGESQTIQQLVPVGSVPASSNTDLHAVYSANKTQAFSSLLGLGQSQQSAEVAGKQIEGSLSAERIRAAADEVAQSYQYKTALAGYDRDLGLGGLQSKTAQYLADVQSSTQRELQRDYLASMLDQLSLQTAARRAEVEQQIAAVASVGQTYRNQSLERQGTILNALTSVWGQQPYTYQTAFGGPRPPSFLQQLFPGGIGDTLKSLFGAIF